MICRIAARFATLLPSASFGDQLAVPRATSLPIESTLRLFRTQVEIETTICASFPKRSPPPLGTQRCGVCSANSVAAARLRPAFASRIRGMQDAADGAKASEQAPVFTSEFLLRPSSLNGAAAPCSGDTVVILLNYELPRCTPRLMAAARLRVCADGGANRLYEALPRWRPDAKPDELRRQFAPDAITGDMDSASEPVLGYYAAAGVQVEALPEDQDSTDLHKCLAYAERRLGQHQLRRLTVLVLGAMGGRIDHTLSNLNTLLSHAHLRLVLIGDGSTARLLPAGASVVRPAPGVEGPTCSLVPLAGSAVATSSGLKWNLKETRMQFGGLISTSNIMVDDTIHVHSDLPLLWTTEFADQA